MSCNTLAATRRAQADRDLRPSHVVRSEAPSAGHLDEGGAERVGEATYAARAVDNIAEVAELKGQGSVARCC